MQKAEARPRQHDHFGGAARGRGGERAAGVPVGPMEIPAGLMLEPSLYTVKAIFILDSFGQRLLAKQPEVRREAEFPTEQEESKAEESPWSDVRLKILILEDKREIPEATAFEKLRDAFRPTSEYYDDTFPSMKEQKSFERNVFNKTHKTDSEIAFLEGLTIVYKSSIDLFFYVVGSPHENELMLMSVLTCLFESLSHMLRKNVEKRTLVENMDGVFLVVDEIVDGGVILESDAQQVIQKLNFRVDDSSLSEHSVTQVLQSAKEQIKWSLLK